MKPGKIIKRGYKCKVCGFYELQLGGTNSYNIFYKNSSGYMYECSFCRTRYEAKEENKKNTKMRS